MRHFLIAILTLMLPSTVSSGTQPGGGEFLLPKSTISSGGNVSTGGVYSISGTIGQFEANAESSTAGPYAAAGGFWALATDTVFEDGFE